MARIVHVEDYFDPTAGYQINELIRVQSKENEVYIITSKDMSPFHKKEDKSLDFKLEEKNGVKIIRLESGFKLAGRIRLIGLWKEIEKLSPDLVFLHGIGDFKDLILFQKTKKYVVVRDCHMSWVAVTRKFNKTYYKIYSKIFAKIINKTNKYEKIFALGIEEYQYLKALGIDDKKIDYLYHGYNDEMMYYSIEERDEIREAYNITKDEIVISYIGKFNNSKRPDLVFDIVNGLKKELVMKNKITLLFIGSKNEKFMEKFNEKKSLLNENIRVIEDDSKPFNELRKYFSASDICIFPKETTLSSIHAQVCGCPVIMENHISNEERVVNKEMLYDIDDIEAGTKILKKIITEKKYEKEYNIGFMNELRNREYKRQISKLTELI